MSWISTTLIGSQQTGAAIPWARPLFEAYVTGAWILYWTDDTLYWVAKPAVHVEQMDGWRRLHCADGPAIESDVENLYFWNGVFVPAFAVTRPEWITTQHIQQEDNAEVRRVLIERMGFERFVLESGAQPIHADDTGTLYRIDLEGDEPLVVVSLINSTPEAGQAEGLVQAPDGSWRKRYLIRVPPDMTTARQAVAWTFNMQADDYQPAVET